MSYEIRLTPEAESDLRNIYDYIRAQTSDDLARAYVGRLLEFLARFDEFPERGTLRDDIRPGLRIVGFERRVSIPFVVEHDQVIVLRVLYAGRDLKLP